MQLLLASDLHYRLPQFDWLLEQASDFDAVILAGDHLDISSPVPLESQIVVLETYFEKFAEVTKLIVCSGNHDLTARNEHGEKSAPWIESHHGPAIVDWKTLDHDDLRITVCPWWDGPKTRDDVDAQLTKDAANRPGRWVWIYHFPPDEAAVSWIGKRHVGDTDLNRWIDQHQPDLVLSGHIHQSPFVDGGSWISRLGKSWVVNAGSQPGTIPPHAIIDCAEGTAEWSSITDQGQEQLWPPISATST